MVDGFREAMVGLMPALRGFAMSLAGARGADDLVQETCERALRYRDSFQDGTNLKSWLYKILQNCFYQDIQRNRMLVEDVEGREAARQTVEASQEWRLRYSEILAVVNRMPADARDAILLVGAQGLSYEEAAEVSACPVGTLKSRVNRARERLAQFTQTETADTRAGSKEPTV